MKINRKLNTLTAGEYAHLLANYRKFTDFNHLGLFRSILENEQLTPAQRVEVREAAAQAFPGFFEFLQLKDPFTYFSLVTLGQELTVADESQVWHDIKQSQQRILAAKRLGHRNFGTYARHDCGYDFCPYNGLMVRPGSRLAEGSIRFHTDHHGQPGRLKAQARKRHGKQQQRLIEQDLLLDAPAPEAGER